MDYKRENMKLLEMATEKEQERIYYFLRNYIQRCRKRTNADYNIVKDEG